MGVVVALPVARLTAPVVLATAAWSSSGRGILNFLYALARARGPFLTCLVLRTWVVEKEPSSGAGVPMRGGMADAEPAVASSAVSATCLREIILTDKGGDRQERN